MAFNEDLGFFYIKEEKKKASAVAACVTAAAVTGCSGVEVVLKRLCLPGLGWSHTSGSVFPLSRTLFIYCRHCFLL